jgi:hypothetical protein
MNIKTFALGAVIALSGSLATTPASAALRVVNVSNVTQLYKAFGDADADANNQYEIRMAAGYYRLTCPPNDGDTSNHTRGSLKLRYGNVRLIGAASEGDNSDYMIDGGYESNLCSSIFYVGNSTTFQPRLEVRNVKLQNAYSNQYGRSPIDVTNATLILSGVRMQRMRSQTPGGAIYASRSNVTITSTFIQDANIPSATVDYCGGVVLSGGALYLSNTSASIRNSTITSSGACRGGAIWWAGSSFNSLTIDQSTFAQNWAINRGGALIVGGPGSLNIIFSTIASNTAAISNRPVSEGRYGGGIAFAGFTGPLNMYGNIIAQNVTLYPAIQNQPTPDGKDCYVVADFTTNRSLGTQLVGERGNCSFFPTSPLVGTASFPVNPGFVGLSSMANISGAFFDVYPLDDGSPALGAFSGSGGPQSCRSTDQLGMSRFSPCDLGSIEKL